MDAVIYDGMTSQKKTAAKINNYKLMLKNILNLTKAELVDEIKQLKLPAFRANQIWNWLYVFAAKDFSQMANIGKALQDLLAQNFAITYSGISKDILSQDGTRKWLIKLHDDKEVETVFIPEETRGTLCISSQVGCTLACKFCYTGTQLFVRNLTADEIVGQVLIAKELLVDKKITNIVFMGMGEPFYNYDNVAKAVKILTDMDGLAFSNRRITISTSGLVPEILRCATELKTCLAISLHAPNDEVRTAIMAINKKYPLAELMAACKEYIKINPNKKIMLEYVMLKDVNDEIKHAQELVKLIQKSNLSCKINMIPFNSWMGCGYERSSDDKIIAFQKILKKANLIATVRKTRGDDVLAACGQLKSASKRMKNSPRL